MKPLLIVDANSLAHAAFHANKLSVNGQGSQVTLSVTNALRSLISTQFVNNIVVFVWDCPGGSQYRKAISLLYKANRKNDSPEKIAEREDLRQQCQDLRLALTTLGITQMLAPGFEADDLAFQLVRNYQGRVNLVTGDRDWLQMITTDNVCWFYHRVEGRRVVGLGNFESETGVKTHEQFIEMKALMGDTSDNIVGVGGIGEKTAQDLLNRHGSVRAFLQWVEEEKPALPSSLLRLVTNKSFEYRGKSYPPPLEVFEKNLSLVDLRRCPKIEREQIQTIQGRFDLNAFGDLCHRLAYQSLLTGLETWAKPFELRGK